MAKKTNPESVGAAATEDPSVAVERASEVVTDPILLGVQVPLAVTAAALKQVTGAWRACFVALAAAARAKVLKTGEPVDAPVTTIEA